MMEVVVIKIKNLKTYQSVLKIVVMVLTKMMEKKIVQTLAKKQVRIKINSKKTINLGENIRKELTEKIVEFQAALVKKDQYTSEGSRTLEEKTKRLKEVEDEFNREDGILQDLETKKNQLEEVEKAEQAVQSSEELKQHQEEAKKFEKEGEQFLGEEKPKEEEKPNDSGNPFMKFIENENAEKPKEEEKSTGEEKPAGEVENKPIEPSEAPKATQEVNQGKKSKHKPNNNQPTLKTLKKAFLHVL